MHQSEVVIDGNSLTLDQVTAVARGDRARVSVAPHARQRARLTRGIVESLVSKRAVAYGVTTGFGKLSEVAIPPRASGRAAGESRAEPRGGRRRFAAGARSTGDDAAACER